MLSRHGLLIAARTASPVFLGLGAILLTTYGAVLAFNAEALAADMHYVYWGTARDLLSGLSPYVEPDDPVVAGAAAFVYPAPTALLFAPFGLLPKEAADVVFTVLLDLCAVLTLAVLNVRDWRVYAITFLLPTTFYAWQLGNVTLPLALGIALTYRYRDRPVVAGTAVALVVGLKLFLWPVGVWLIATRRFAACGWALVTGIAANVVAWAVIGFDQIPRYVDLLRALTDAGESRAYSVMALLMQQGVTRSSAYAIGLLLAASALVIIIVLARRGRDAQALAIAIAAALLASPLVWLHYFALVMVPLAITRPTISALWFAPALLWLCPPTRPTTAELCLALGVMFTTLGATVLSPRPPARLDAQKRTSRSGLRVRRPTTPASAGR